jgi:hypothetical protein
MSYNSCEDLPGLGLDDWLRAEQEIVQAEMAWLDERTTEIG